MTAIYILIAAIATAIAGLLAAQLVIPIVMFAVSTFVYGVMGWAAASVVLRITRRNPSPIPSATAREIIQ